MTIENKKARFNYEIIDTYEAGIVLKGSEIKSVREGHASLDEAYGIIKNDEAYLINMFIKEYKEANILNHEERRTRKLLLHKKEIYKIKRNLEIKGLTLVPLKLYIKNNYAKVLLGVGKGKKLHDKRESIKQRDIKRRIEHL